MKRALRPRTLWVLGALLVLSLLAAGPHELLHDHGETPDCELCALTATEVADAPRVARADFVSLVVEVPNAEPLPSRDWQPASPRAPPLDR